MANQILIDALRLNVQILRDFIATIPDGELRNRRREGFWSIHEHLNHLVITQIMLCRRIELFIKEDRPVIVPFVPDGKPKDESSASKPAGELLDAFAKWREKQLHLLETCADGTWARTALHPEYLSYTFEILVRHILLHDSFHMNRIEELWLLKDQFLKNW
jgi:uncharacterized damage-inducible protein DinB